MSTLRTTNIKHETSSNNNITLDRSGGVIIAGVTTVSAGSTSAPSITPSGDSNTGIFFPSADTVAIAEGGVEVLRINSSGNVGIGTTDSLNKFEVGNVSGGVTTPDFTVSTVSLGSSVTIGRLSSVSNDNTSFRIRDRVNRTLLYTGPATVDIGQTDFASTHLTIKNGNLIFGVAGTGIDFSATANSSGTMSSELLSDYEEGTWTPVYFLGGVQQSYNTDILAYYTKIGRMVYVNFWTGWGAYGRDNFPSGSGSRFEIGGLPYSITENYKPGAIGQARTQGGLSANFSIGADGADRICFYSTGGGFSSWSGSGGLAASSISSIAAPVIAGAFWYIN